MDDFSSLGGNSFSGFDINKINGLAMDWDPTPILQALQQYGGQGMQPQASPEVPGAPNPEGLPGPGQGGNGFSSFIPPLGQVAQGATPGAPAPAKGAAPLSVQQQQALAAMQPRRPAPIMGPSPVAPNNHSRNVSFANVGPGGAPQAPSSVPSLAAILSGHR